MGLTARSEKNLRNTIQDHEDEINELWETIEWLNSQIEERKPAPAVINVRRACITLLKEEAKNVSAVKLYRDRMGVDLKTAIAAIRSLKNEILEGKHGEFNPNLR